MAFVRKASSVMMLAMLLTSTLTLAFSIQPVKAEGTIYIRADGSIDPPTAPISTVDNVTYTLTGNITSDADGIVVERDNIVVDGMGHTLEGMCAGGSKGIDLTGRRNVTIKGMEITAFYYGFLLFESFNNSVIGNNITNNKMHGIWLYESSNNRISGNSMENNYRGIQLYFSSNTTLRDNIISNNQYNIGVYGESPSYYINDIDTSNSVDGKPIYYWVNRHDVDVPVDAGYVALVNCQHITVKNQSLTKNMQGILLAYTANSTIIQNEMASNYCGIMLWNSSHNYVAENNMTNNDSHGIGLCWSSDYNEISENKITTNYGMGIYFHWSSNNKVFRNKIENNNIWGIWFEAQSNYNSIVENNITNNGVAAGVFSDSSSNIVYHNNFVNNAFQIYSYAPNVWNGSYSSGGNYWDDYVDLDFFRGLYQNETGSDGIWDHPYIINENNRDHYPLVNPWTPIPLVINATIDIIPNTLNLRSKAGYVTAFIELPEGYDVADINVSTVILNDTIPVDPSAPKTIGDYDNDGVPDLMVKFDRAQVSQYILDHVSMTEQSMRVTLTVTGKLNDGTPFQGSATITVLVPMQKGRQGIYPK